MSDTSYDPLVFNRYNDFSLSQCKVTLKNKELWKKFHDMETEMIITKNGRRMFPSFHIDVTCLEPEAYYCVLLQMTPASHCRYKYSVSGGWAPAGTEEPQSQNCMYLHPESPAKGDYWMSQPISFGRLKLTNTPAPPPGQVVLTSMHKYQPRVIIVKTHDPRAISWSPTTSATFPETQFIAVTAYQNEKITKLKIDNNPFAKGFRENGQSKCKRKRAVMEADKSHEEDDKIVIDVDSTEVSEIDDDRLSASSTSSTSELSPNKSLPSRTSVSPASASREYYPNYNVSPINCCVYPFNYNTHMSSSPVPYACHYSYNYTNYPAYSSPVMWHQPEPYFGGYQQRLLSPIAVPEDLSVQNVAKKPRKITDFSIKSILGS